MGNSAREILFIDRESVRARAVQADPSAVLSQQKLVEAAFYGLGIGSAFFRLGNAVGSCPS